MILLLNGNSGLLGDGRVGTCDFTGLVNSLIKKLLLPKSALLSLQLIVLLSREAVGCSGSHSQASMCQAGL